MVPNFLVYTVFLIRMYESKCTSSSWDSNNSEWRYYSIDLHLKWVSRWSCLYFWNRWTPNKKKLLQITQRIAHELRNWKPRGGRRQRNSKKYTMVYGSWTCRSRAKKNARRPWNAELRQKRSVNYLLKELSQEPMINQGTRNIKQLKDGGQFNCRRKPSAHLNMILPSRW
jgi:hypothetical protein